MEMVIGIIGAVISGLLSIITVLLLLVISRQGKTNISIAKLETRMENFQEMKDDIKKHAERITILEPRALSAHTRIDKIKEEMKC